MLNLLIFILMLNPATLSSKLAGLIGFRQPLNPEYAIVDAANLASRSGLYVTDNPFVKIESIKDSQDYAGADDIAFNKFLRNKIATSIVNVGNAVFNEMDYIDRNLIYKNALNKFSQTNGVNTYDIPPGFSAYWIQVTQKKDIAFKIERVLLEFTGTGNLKLYLYNTADLTTPLQSKVINITSPFQEEKLDWICDNTGRGYKGDYYLGYFQSECDASLKPFKREYREAILMSDIDQLYIQRSNFKDFVNPASVLDLMQFSPYVLYNGVNPDITVYEDFTDLMIQNEKLFARAILLDCQISLLSESIATLRSNATQRISGSYVAQMMSQIEGESRDGNAPVKGLRPQFYGAIGSIRK